MAAGKYTKNDRKSTKRYVRNLLRVLLFLMSIETIICAVYMRSFISSTNRYRRLEGYLRQNKLRLPDQICNDLTIYDSRFRNFSVINSSFYKTNFTTTTKLLLSNVHEQSLLVDFYSRLSAEELATRLLPEAIYTRIDALPFARSLFHIRETTQKAIYHLDELKITLDAIRKEIDKIPLMPREKENGHEKMPINRLRAIIHEYEQSVDHCCSILHFNREQQLHVATQLSLLASGKVRTDHTAKVNALAKPLVTAWLKLNQDNMEKSHATIAWFHGETFKIANDKNYPQEMLTVLEALPYLRPNIHRLISGVLGMPQTEKYVLKYEAWH